MSIIDKLSSGVYEPKGTMPRPARVPPLFSVPLEQMDEEQLMNLPNVAAAYKIQKEKVQKQAEEYRKEVRRCRIVLIHDLFCEVGLRHALPYGDGTFLSDETEETYNKWLKVFEYFESVHEHVYEQVDAFLTIAEILLK
jgi:hypothetical protein